MDLTIIVAVSENNVIGNGGKLPWRIKEDMLRFRRLTLGHPVIMGRKTYEALPKRFSPLPDRKNIVLSRSLQSKEGIYVARTIDEAVELMGGMNSYIIGGEGVYDSFLPLSNRIELTRVHRSYEGDAFFPDVDFGEWDLIQEVIGSTSGFEYSFLTYKRN